MSLRRSSRTQTFEPAASSQRRKWTAEEDDYLRSQVEKFQQAGDTINWTDVAQDLDGRTNKDCRKRWLKIDSRWSNGSWAPDEDDRLRRAVRLHEGRWKTVSDQVRTRNPDQCAKRWRNSLDPQLQRNDWTPDEDELLISAVTGYGRNWKVIASTYFKSRSRLDLSNRYTMLARKNLDPEDYRRVMSHRTPSFSPPGNEEPPDGQENDNSVPEADLSWGRSAAETAALSMPTRAVGPVAYRPHPAAAAAATYAPQQHQQRSADSMAIEANLWPSQQIMYPSYIAMTQGAQAPAPHMNVRIGEPVVKVEYQTPPTTDGSMHQSRPAYY